MQKYISATGSLFLLILIIGFLFANNILVMISIIPLIALAFSYFLKVPGEVKIKKTIFKNRATVGELLEVNLKILIGSGYGPVEICDVIPENFELVEGNNYSVIWKGNKVEETEISYKIKCTTSGNYKFNITKWKCGHPVCNFWESGQVENNFFLEITPRLLELKKIRGISTVSKIPMPQGALASMGMTTQDFKEIRLYYPGDPFKLINWKVTSRNLLRGNVWPVVNQFEKEGKKTVWIFLDTSKVMGYGSNVKNVIEYSVESVNGLADYYLKQQCSLAFATYGGSRDVLVTPGSGKHQYYRVLKELIKIKDQRSNNDNSYNSNKTLYDEVYSLRGHFPGVRPLFVIITRFCNNNFYDIQKSVNAMSGYTTRNGLLPSIVVLNIVGYELMTENKSEKLASELLQAMNKIISNELRKKCIWIDWNPAKESLTAVLLKQVVEAR
ncbi:UNVERIFIED_CONTAM: uncharacterized protein (DUF58 family) [Acetivibrio alkalicellulosi]